MTQLLHVAAITVLLASAAPPLRFEVVSVKSSTESSKSSRSNLLPGGRFTASNMTAKALIRSAFAVQDSQITGDPVWAATEAYDIEGLTGRPEKITLDELQPLMQSLLEERFKLRFHHQTKEIGIYSLVIAKSGPKLASHTSDAGRSLNTSSGAEKTTMRGIKVTLSDLATNLGRYADRPIVNNTGLAGDFDLVLEWTQDPNANATGPSLFTAIQEQLGLRLNSEKSTAEMLVVDNIERASEN